MTQRGTFPTRATPSVSRRLPKTATWFDYCASVIRLGRPKFLLGGLALFGLGTLCARAVGDVISPGVYFWGQINVSAIQLMTHYSNDYFDYRADCANRTPTRWSGGSRVLVRGEIPRITALVAALVLALVACAATAMLVLVEGVAVKVAVPVLGSMLILSWFYSAPPLRLHSRGLGAPTVAIVVPFLTPICAFMLQVENIQLLPIALTLPLVALQLNMLFTLEFPDEQGDRSVAKRTWVVVFGARRIASLSMSLIVAAFVFSFATAGRLVPSVVLWGWLAIVPLAVVQALRLAKGDWQKPQAWESLAFGSVALFFLAIVGDVVALARAADLI